MSTLSRRGFIQTAAAAAAAAAAGGAARAQAEEKGEGRKREFEISLAAWSLHRTIGTGEDKIPMLEMPRLAREEFGIDAIELVNHMMASSEPEYLAEFAENAAKHEIDILLIMIDGQGDIGSRSENMRGRAVENHQRWIDIAQGFGCHSIRMNWTGAPRDWEENPEALDEFIARSVPGLQTLCDYGNLKNINVLIENHGGPSSHIAPMQRLVEAVNHPRFGTLPDFGNFPPEVDMYDAVDALMPHAKAVSAKCYDFDPDTGLETRIDFERMIEIVVDKHGYRGHIGIEYEGREMSEFEGIKACKALLKRLRG